MLPSARTKRRNQKALRTQTLDVWRGQHQCGKRHTGEVKTAMTSVMISLETTKVLRTGSLDEANEPAIPVSKSGQMKRTMSSGASWKVTMTMIVRTSC